MLRILQTGDLHLGKVFYEYSLLTDQEYMLDRLTTELENFNYDALLITGDIYDRSIPPPEAVSLFDRFLNRIRTSLPELPVCIIPGNHDSAKRLAFGSELFRNQNIYISTDPQNCERPILIKNQNGRPEAALYQLPFLQSASLSSPDGTVLRTQQELVQEAVKRIGDAHRQLRQSADEFKNLAAILSCHLFTSGAQAGGSERIFIGNAEHINAAVFAPFDYIAAGHIHKTQKINDRLYYAGSPLAYSFDESDREKNFLRIELDFSSDGTTFIPKISSIPVKSLHRLRRITGSFEDLFRTNTYDDHKDDYIEFTYTDAHIVENAAARLREHFPLLLSVKQQNTAEGKTGGSEKNEKKRQLLERSDSLPLKDILYAFLTDVGLLDETHSAKADWEQAAELFVKLESDEAQNAAS